MFTTSDSTPTFTSLDVSETENMTSASGESFNVSSQGVVTASNASDSDSFELGVSVLYTCGEAVIALLIIIGNSLVIQAIRTEKRLQTFTNLFIVSLAVADLLVGAVGIPLAQVAFYGYPRSFAGCLLANTVIVMLTQVSVFGLLVISLERYVAIKSPFLYQQHNRTRTAVVVIVVQWSLGLLTGAVPLMGWNNEATYSGDSCTFSGVVSMEFMVYFHFFACTLPPLALMIGVYAYIYVIVRQQKRKILQQRNEVGSHFSASADSIERGLTSPASRHVLHEAPSERRATLYTISSSASMATSNGRSSLDSNANKREATPNDKKRARFSKHSQHCDAAQQVATSSDTDTRTCKLTSVSVLDLGYSRRPSLGDVTEDSADDVRNGDAAHSDLNNVTSHHRTATVVRPKSATSRGQYKRWLRSFRKDWRAAKWFCVVICCFVVCWLPLHIMNSVSLLHAPVSTPLVIVAIILSHANSAVNPVLYAYSNSKFKRAMLALVTCHRRRARGPGSPSSTNPSPHSVDNRARF